MTTEMIKPRVLFWQNGEIDDTSKHISSCLMWRNLYITIQGPLNNEIYEIDNIIIW